MNLDFNHLPANRKKQQKIEALKELSKILAFKEIKQFILDKYKG